MPFFYYFDGVQDHEQRQNFVHTFCKKRVFRQGSLYIYLIHHYDHVLYVLSRIALIKIVFYKDINCIQKAGWHNVFDAFFDYLTVQTLYHRFHTYGVYLCFLNESLLIYDCCPLVC